MRQFVAMLRKLAIEIDCAVLLLSHPSLSGIQSGSGSSGSTAWNNSARSRLYLTRGKDDEDLRILTTVKSNYGKVGTEIRMRWQDGCFALDDGSLPPTTGLLNRKHEETFMRVPLKLNEHDINVSANAGPTYAPSKIAAHPDGKGSTKRQLADAMARLLDAGKIKVVTEGSASRKRSRIVPC